jgi:hypothetical protein
MPPWPASTHDGGPFRDVRSLSEAEITTLLEWVEAGCPQGDPADAPAPADFADEWPLGPPDLILSVPETYELGASGPDEYRVFVVPTGLTEGKWVAAVDYRPGNLKVVHHIIGAYDLKGRARILDAADPKSGYKAFGGFAFLPDGFFSGWTPGRKSAFVAPGTGRYLPAKSDLLIQVHYHKSGKVESDRTRVGLYFAKQPVEKELSARMIAPPVSRFRFQPDLIIPAGSGNHEVKGSLTLQDVDRHLVSVMPHMHWLGKDFQLTATFPNGSTRTLIKIDRWDFDWQDLYDFTEPLAMPKGTRIDMLAHFDNSASNPNNPSSPPTPVRWGEQTTDEMCLAFLYLTRDDQQLHNRPPARFRVVPTQEAPRP